MQHLVVSDEQGGMRLDRLVASHLGLSRRCARLLISAGRIQLGGRTCRILTRTVNAGCRVSVLAESTPPFLVGAQAQAAAIRPSRPAPCNTPDILYQDRWLIAVNKPSGLLSEGDRFGGPCVETWLGAWLRRQGELDALWLVHRLDAGTSGVLLLARHRGVAAALGEAFRERTAKKRYVALVLGSPVHDPWLCEAPIARVAGTRHGVMNSGKPASTEFRVTRSTSSHALVSAAPLTGRTHQIRVHLAHGGHPIMGDRLYGGPGYGPQAASGGLPGPIPRPMLHAASLTLRHPKTCRPITFHAAVPSDFMSLQAALGLGH